ncbi:hypothetical protein CHUAL_010070 [Chamberlinius hualienensis]
MTDSSINGNSCAGKVDMAADSNCTSTGIISPNPTAEELQVLAKMEELNRQLEADAKSLNSLSGTSGHSRKSSDTSQISITSATSQLSNNVEEDPEDTWQTWGRIVAEWDVYSKKKTTYVKDMVRKGIPHHFRGLVWQLLGNAHNSAEKEKYADYIKQSSPCEKVIRRDIARTYPEHEFFKEKDGPGQESLFNVMKAYSLHDREVGYCQGSAFIVGLLLMQMPEEEAFAVLVKLMQDYKMREMFKPSMAELGLCIYQLECMVQELLPELHMHFQSQGLHTSMYASSWFLTLYSTSLLLPLAFRVMDVFISEGMEMIFRIAISILQTCKDELMSQDMEGMIRFLQKDMPVFYDNDPELLMNVAYQVKYNGKKMKKLEKEYTAKRTKEQEEMVEIRRLRTENRLLRQRIDHLEQESSSLADRLIQGQVTRAQEAEETFALKRELGAAKQQNQELQKILEDAHEKIKQQNESAGERGSKDADELITVLQEELVNNRLREAELHVVMKELKLKVDELEEANKNLRDIPPDDNVAHLQEELISLKLREAEGALAMKELSQRIDDLSILWEKHLRENHQGENGKKLRDYGRNTLAQLQEDLLTAKLDEAKAAASLIQNSHRLMELETQNQIYLNQIRRQEDELRRLETKIQEADDKDKERQHVIRDQDRKLTDLESKIETDEPLSNEQPCPPQMKEDLMMARIREMERNQHIAELEQKLSSVECKHEELKAVSQLNDNDNEELRELSDRIADYQAEVLQLKAINKKLTLALTINGTNDRIPVAVRNGVSQH